MEPRVDDGDFRLYVGNALDVLRELPDESIHCVVTSPPYWGLRDYGTGQWGGGDPDCQHRVGGQVQDNKAKGAITAGVRPGVDATTCLDCGATRIDQQLGLEPTPEAYVGRVVEIFREVRRLLRADGTCWLNLGDSYASDAAKGGSGTPNGRNNRGENYARPGLGGLKQKDLVGIPWRVAFALQADGWYLRSDIIWAKPNAMPESVTDRPTKAHEYLFLLTKAARYFYDADAIREPAEWARWGDQTYSPEAEKMYGDRIKPRKKADLTPRKDGDRWNEADGRGFIPNQAGRNARSVWEIVTDSYAGAHFAVFPEELPRRCIAAGTSEHGCCPACGVPWGRETVRTRSFESGSGRSGRDPEGKNGPALQGGDETGDIRRGPVVKVSTSGWSAACDHGDREPVPCVVLDPFIGSGTTAEVARKLGRRCVGIELNEEYATLILKRTQQLSLLG